MDVIIKNVPEGCEDKVREMALVAIERFLAQSVKVDKAVQTKFETDVDIIRVSNDLDKKYEKINPVIETK